MPNLTQQQINEALKKGVSQDQINNYIGKNVFEKITPAEKIGNFLGITPTAKRIAGEIAKDIPIPKVVAPVNYQGTQDQFQREKQQQFRSDLEKDLPTFGQQVAGSAKLGLTLAGLKTPPIASTLKGRTLEFGVLGATFQALDNIENKQPIGDGVATAGAIAGALPIVGTVLSKGLGKIFKGTAQRIENTLIKPLKADLEDGFKIQNINKYKIYGDLTQKAKKVEQLLSQKTQLLKQKIGSRSDVVIDLNSAVDKTAEAVLKNKSKTFGNLSNAKKAIEQLANEVELYSKNGLVDLPEAQVIKQSAGKQGAWLYGFLDPEAKAKEFVYTKFYRILRQEIEKKAPEGVKQINREISDLIPIMHAIERRIPVSERNNVLSLSDIITGGIAIGNPKAFGLFALNRALKSGSVAKLLQTSGEILDITPKSALGQRILGKPFKRRAKSQTINLIIKKK